MALFLSTLCKRRHPWTPAQKDPSPHKLCAPMASSSRVTTDHWVLTIACSRLDTNSPAWGTTCGIPTSVGMMLLLPLLMMMMVMTMTMMMMKKTMKMMPTLTLMIQAEGI
jgi:hypothetical protein